METPDLSQFAKYIPGFDFLQNLTRQATGSVPSAAMPPLGHWVAPTFSVDELDKRIRDLRAVQFWLDQNSTALGATIQALEVQKMTLATLKGMNLSLQDVAESFKIKPEPMQTPPPFFWGAQPAPPASEPPAAAPAEPPPEEEEAEPARPAVDAMQWWSSLTEQFGAIAASTMQDMAGQAAKAAEQMAQTVQAGTEAASKMAEQAAQAAQAAQAQAAQAAEAGADAARPAAKRARSAAAKTARKTAAKQPGESGS